MFFNCSCVEAGSNGRYSEAKEGKCEADCKLLVPFLLIMCLLILLATVSEVPAVSAALRCVPDEQRSVAVALKWLFARCLGYIPGPVIYGAVIDKACLFWKESCDDDETGACYYYDNANLSNFFLGLSLGCKGVAIILYALSLVLYKPPPAADVTDVVKAVSPTSDAGVSNLSFNASKE